MKDLLRYYIQAGFSGLMIKSPEETRVQRMFREIVQEFIQKNNEYDLYTFDMHEGLVNILEEGGNGTTDPIDAMTMAANMDGSAITVFSDFHVFLEQGGPEVALHVKRALRIAKSKGNHLVFVGCRTVIPAEIERELTVLEFDLPTRKELEAVVIQTAEDAGVDKPNGQMQSIVGALQGLTLAEASDALAFSLVKNRRFDPQDIAMEKAKQINKSGLMKVVSGEGTLDDIGGLEKVKEWVLARTNIFDPRAKEHGATPAKGVCTIGVPGSGKSLLSRVLGNVFGLPVLKINMGALFGSLVGQSEENFRKVKQTAMAMAPCIVELDEVDKGVGSAMGGISTDSGTTDRVIQDLLSWMGEEHEGVFISATANDPEKMRASGGALLRKGRFDEVFFFDFPHALEREQIFRIHINKRSRPACASAPVGGAEEFDLAPLVEASEGFTGSEIEAAVADAFSNAWNRKCNGGKHELTLDHILYEISQVNPLSESQKDGIASIRAWASSNCRAASAPDPTRAKATPTKQRSIVVPSEDE